MKEIILSTKKPGKSARGVSYARNPVKRASFCTLHTMMKAALVCEAAAPAVGVGCGVPTLQRKRWPPSLTSPLQDLDFRVSAALLQESMEWVCVQPLVTPPSPFFAFLSIDFLTVSSRDCFGFCSLTTKGAQNPNNPLLSLPLFWGR